jgi:sulfur carrier protein ThiS
MKIKLMGEWAVIAGSKEVMLMYDPSNIRSLFIRLEIEYPCGKWDQAIVAINGVLYTSHNKTIVPEEDEVCIMPHIEGG